MSEIEADAAAPALFDPDRFIEAQNGVFETALAELARGRKQSHWMWFVFPQLRGLGRSMTAVYFGLVSVDAARAFLAHPVLGPRLVEATEAALDAPAPSLNTLFGSPDDLKFRSSMTLFALADPAGREGLFQSALERWCAGAPDPETLRLLRL